MSQLILGAILGATVSSIIAHFYYRRSSQDLQRQTDALRRKLANLESIIEELQEATGSIWESTEMVKKHVVAGTPDDSEWPYK